MTQAVVLDPATLALLDGEEEVLEALRLVGAHEVEAAALHADVQDLGKGADHRQAQAQDGDGVGHRDLGPGVHRGAEDCGRRRRWGR